MAKIREEEEKRREVSAKFQTTLSDITGTMNENNQKNTKLTEENIEMSKKLKSLCEQYEQNNSVGKILLSLVELAMWFRWHVLCMCFSQTNPHISKSSLKKVN